MSDPSATRKPTPESATIYLRLTVGFLCLVLVVLHLFKYHDVLVPEGIFLYFFGVLSGYYFTSAWYLTRARQRSKL